MALWLFVQSSARASGINRHLQGPIRLHALECCAQVGQGRGAEVMGHPLEPLVWLANMLAERGKALTAGMTVPTGSTIPPKPLSAGDTATIVIDGLGEGHVTVL